MDYINRIKAVAGTGLLYATNDYDKERYEELLNISVRLMSEVSGHSEENLKVNFSLVKDYPTAKVDIRGIVLSADKKNCHG